MEIRSKPMQIVEPDQRGPTGRELLDLPMDPAQNAPGASSLREYLAMALAQFAGMWSRVDDVDRPFGHGTDAWPVGDWKFAAFNPMIKAGYLAGAVHADERTGRESVSLGERGAAEALLFRAIDGMRG